MADWGDCHESFDTNVRKFGTFVQQRKDILGLEAGFAGLLADVYFQQNVLDNALLCGFLVKLTAGQLKPAKIRAKINNKVLFISINKVQL